MASTFQQSVVVVIGTGGTIAGRSASPQDNLGYVAAQEAIGSLMASLQRPAVSEVITEQLAQVDSKDMSFPIWQALAARCQHWLDQPQVQGLVITHGTDTLEETAFLLAQTLSSSKPVVMTCAMRPANSLGADGPGNLRDALVLAQTATARGVLVVCAGVVHLGTLVRKRHTYRLDAFSSGDESPLGYMEEGRLRRLREWPQVQHRSACLDALASGARAPRVEIIQSHAAADGLMLRLLLAHRAQGHADAVEGIVLAATGNGTLHQELETAALEAQAMGVRVLRATRCAEGRILPGGPARFADAGGLTPAQARVRLMLELLCERNRQPTMN